MTSSSPSWPWPAPDLRRLFFREPFVDQLAHETVVAFEAPSTSHSDNKRSAMMSQTMSLSAEPRTGWAVAKCVLEGLKAETETEGGGAWVEAALILEGPATGCLGAMIAVRHTRVSIVTYRKVCSQKEVRVQIGCPGNGFRAFSPVCFFGK